MDRFLKRSVSETLEEALVSPFFMTTQIYPLGHDTIFYTCHIANLDNIAVRFDGCELIYTHGKYDAYCTGMILGKSFSEIHKGFEIDIDPDHQIESAFLSERFNLCLSLFLSEAVILRLRDLS